MYVTTSFGKDFAGPRVTPLATRYAGWRAVIRQNEIARPHRGRCGREWRRSELSTADSFGGGGVSEGSKSARSRPSLHRRFAHAQVVGSGASPLAIRIAGNSSEFLDGLAG